MMMPIDLKLSILIATMPSRRESYANLWDCLSANGLHYPTVEVISDDSMGYNIGTKRNKLLQQAKGEYIVFIDDDDTISPDYISKILEATTTNPNCIGISGLITTNGTDKRQWHISKDFGSWHESNKVYYRTPNHISPVRRELALQVGFPEIAHGEDYAYSMRLLPLLKSEVVVSGNLYFYNYRNDK